MLSVYWEFYYWQIPNRQTQLKFPVANTTARQASSCSWTGASISLQLRDSWFGRAPGPP